MATSITVDGRKRLEIKDVPSRFEACPPFEKDASKSGRWSFSVFKSQYGSSFTILYDEQEVRANFTTTFSGSFDFNVYNGKPTETCKLSGALILYSSLPEAAKLSIVNSYAQLRADQAVVKDAFAKYLEANVAAIPPPLDGDGKPAKREIKLAARLKIGKPDKKDPSKQMQDTWQISSSLSTLKGDPDVTKHMITSTVILDGKPLIHITRGELYRLVKGGTYFKLSSGKLAAFEGTGGCFIQFKSDKEVLQAIAKKKEKTPEELKKEVDDSALELAKLGIEMKGPSADELEEDGGRPAAAAAAAALPAVAPDGTFKIGAGTFTKMPASGSS